jgi:hypothetical protein
MDIFRHRIALTFDDTTPQIITGESREDLIHNASRDIRESIITSRMAECETFVIQTHQMQDRRVEVVHVDNVFGDIDPILVRFAPGHSGLHTGTSQP